MTDVTDVTDDVRTPKPQRGRIGVLVSGSGTNLQALMDAIGADEEFGGQVVVVASDDPHAAGLARARDAGIAATAVDFGAYDERSRWERDLVDALAEAKAELVVLAGFMRLVSGSFLERWPDLVVNVHPSLLPAFPGAHGVRDALDYGVKVTGATVHLVDERVDHGPIIAQAPVDVHSDDDREALHARIKEHEYRLLPAAVKLLCHGRVEVAGRRTRILPAPDAGALTVLDVEHEDDEQETP